VGGPGAPPPPREPVVRVHLAVVSVLLCVAPFLLFAWAEQHVASGLASIYNATTPLMTTLIALLALPSERPTRTTLSGLLTGFAGVVVVLGPWRGLTGGDGLGQAACLAATLCYGVAFVYLRRFVSPRGLAAIPVATVQVGLGAVIMLVLAPFTATAPVHLSWRVAGQRRRAGGARDRAGLRVEHQRCVQLGRHQRLRGHLPHPRRRCRPRHRRPGRGTVVERTARGPHRDRGDRRQPGTTEGPASPKGIGG